MKKSVTDANLRKEIAFLGRNGFGRDRINSVLGLDLSNSTFYRIKTDKELEFTANEILELKSKHFNSDKDTQAVETRRADVEVKTKKVKNKSNNVYDETSEKLMRYFNISLEDLLNTSEDNMNEKRDLTFIADEFERCFKIQPTEDIIYSFQEKYTALKIRKADALKVITDKIHYVYRRTLSDTHKWKFEEGDNKNRTNYIMGHIINLIKYELDGSSYRAISEPQHKMVEFYKILFNINGQLKCEIEQKIMELQAKFNVFDMINASVLLSKEYNPELDFLNKIEDILK